MSKKKEYKVNKALLIVSILSLLVAIISLIWSYNTQQDLEKTNYNLALVDHRPRVRFFNPKLVGVELLLDSSNRVEFTQGNSFSGKARLNLRLNFINIGNKEAKILGYSIMDTITENQVIKDYIKAGLPVNTYNDRIFTKHRFHELSVYDTAELYLSYTLRSQNYDRFMIHLVVYYENELGQQYDTYYWLTGGLNGFCSRIVLDGDSNEQRVIVETYQQIVDFIDENNYSDAYSISDREASINYFKELTYH